MTQSPDIARPELTLPPAEAAWLAEHLAEAQVVLEYGCGGSTVMAAEAARAVYSVESDLDWALEVAGYLDAHPHPADVHFHPIDIGPTAKWGAPADDTGWRRYHHYPVSVWDRDDFEQPDVVLIDGRFRAACLVTVMLRTERLVAVLFDDYAERKGYHVVERWLGPPEIRGRMARFEVAPTTLPARDLATILDLYKRQN